MDRYIEVGRSYTVHSQVLEAFKVGHGGGDFTIEVVAGDIEFLELGKLANLCWDWPSYVVVLQQAATGGTVKSDHCQKGIKAAIYNVHKKNTALTVTQDWSSSLWSGRGGPRDSGQELPCRKFTEARGQPWGI